MATMLHLDIITPGAVKFQGDAEIVVAPGGAGDLAALPNHAPMLTTLRIGVLRATVADDSGTRRLELAVNGGFMQITPAKVIVLTDVALAADEIRADAVLLEKQRAEEALALLSQGQLRVLESTGFLMAYDDPVGLARELAAFCG